MQLKSAVLVRAGYHFPQTKLLSELLRTKHNPAGRMIPIDSR